MIAVYLFVYDWAILGIGNDEDGAGIELRVESGCHGWSALISTAGSRAGKVRKLGTMYVGIQNVLA